MQRVSSSIRALYDEKYMTENLCSATPSFWEMAFFESVGAANTLEGFVFALTHFHFNCNRKANSSYFCSLWFGGEYICLEASLHADLLCKCIDGGSSKEAGVQMAWSTWSMFDGQLLDDVIFNHPDFAGISPSQVTTAYSTYLETIGNYIFISIKSYPRIRSGETGGKDFVIALNLADAKVWQSLVSRELFDPRTKIAQQLTRVTSLLTFGRGKRNTCLKILVPFQNGNQPRLH